MFFSSILKHLRRLIWELPWEFGTVCATLHSGDNISIACSVSAELLFLSAFWHDASHTAETERRRFVLSLADTSTAETSHKVALQLCRLKLSSAPHSTTGSRLSSAKVGPPPPPPRRVAGLSQTNNQQHFSQSASLMFTEVHCTLFFFFKPWEEAGGATASHKGHRIRNLAKSMLATTRGSPFASRRLLACGTASHTEHKEKREAVVQFQKT